MQIPGRLTATLTPACATKLTALIVACAALAAGAAAQAAPVPVAMLHVPDPGRRLRLPEGRRGPAASASGPATRRCRFGSATKRARAPTAPRSWPTRATSTRIRGWWPPRPSAAGRRSCRRSRSSAWGCAAATPRATCCGSCRTRTSGSTSATRRGRRAPKLEASGSRQVHQARLEAQRDRDPRLLLRRDTTTSIVGSVNGHGVLSTTDSGADQPDGRQTVVTAGAKGSGAGDGHQRASSTTSPFKSRTPSVRREQNPRHLRLNPLSSAGWPRPRLSAPDRPVRRRAWGEIGW